jgi:ATP-binding cassette subfamily E protein 1
MWLNYLFFVARIAVLDRALCIKERCGYVCAKVCPVNRMGKECIIIEKDSGYPAIAEELCTGCGLCVKKCPAQCISIVNLVEEISTPIYQYGINAFRLYGLPLPKEGAVALLGKNGIGKTTAIRLLSRQLKPNFGDVSKKFNDDEILQRLDVEKRRYFSALSGEIKVAHKPQYVEKIKEIFKGKVRTLLEKCGKDISEVVKLFDLSQLLDRDISQLSGGELQKVAMAAVYLRDADIYYFDEFTNYLDIEERLKTAVIVKNLSERKPVVIAEHDLTILDYVSDYVYIFYGEENVYGIVSGVKNVRAGINEYVRGVLKEENVKFRNYELEFSHHSEPEIKTPTKITYGAMKKSYEGFSFSSDEGSIRNGEIIGIVGKNALGKSLFIKMLAGVEKPDNATKALQLKLAYKPQYLEDFARLNIPVFELLKPELHDVFEEAKRYLQIAPLMEKKTGELSGGELQKVALTAILSKDADVYLFDEPSAFLDIEQRFLFAALLRRVISESEKCAFVVDHDIVFIDAISNRLIPFEGKSSVYGHALSPLNKRDGMNVFLKNVGITMRRDKDTNRPRINKPGSSLDREQKENGEYYYSI